MSSETLKKNPIVNLSTEAYERYLVQNESPILIDFWAPWCPPCRAYTPQVETAAEELAGEVRVAKVNIDDEPELAEKFGVRSIPTTVLMRGDKVLDNFVGIVPSAELVTRVRAKLA